jgi:hypothetical protein
MSFLYSSILLLLSVSTVVLIVQLTSNLIHKRPVKKTVKIRSQRAPYQRKY